MARIGKAEWAAKNPPRPGETREQYKARYESDTEEGYLQQAADVVGQAGRGAALGLAKTGTSMVGGIGKLGGSKALRDWARESEQQAQEFYNPQGTAGAVGEFAGRAAGEIGTAMAGVGAGSKLLSSIPRVAAALEAGGKAGKVLKAAPFVGVDVLQGAAQDKGMVLPGTAGAIAENLAFSGTGALGSRALQARAASKAKAAQDAADAAEAQAQRVAQELAAAKAAAESPAAVPPITNPRRLLPSITMASGEAPVPMAYREAFPKQPRGTPLPSDLTGPGAAIPTRGPRRGVEAEPSLQGMAGQPELGPLQRALSTVQDQFAIVPYRQNPALPVSGRGAQMGQEVSDEVTQLRNQLEKMSPKERDEWMAINMPGTDEEELLQILTSRLPGGPLTRAESQSLRGAKAPKMRARSGTADAELLSMLTGGAGGALYGGATAEEGESPLARALAYGAGGAVAGKMLPRGYRFFDAGANPSLAPEQAQSIAKQATAATREGAPLKTAKTPLEEFPENREALGRRLQVEEFAPTERMLFDERVKQFEPTIRRPRTEADLRKEVGNILQEADPQKLLRINPKRATEAEVLATSSLYSDIMQRAAQKRKELEQVVDPDLKAKLYDDIEGMHATADRFLSKIMESNTASGRALQALNYTASKITDPTYWHIRASRIKNVGALTDLERDTITKMATEGDSEKLLQYLARLQKSSVAEQVAQIRSAGLLTAIPGRARDLISTSGNYLSNVIQRYPGTAADILASHLAARKIGGEAQQFRTMALPSAGEAGAAAKGAMEGLRRAAESMGFDAAKAGGMKQWVEYIRQAELDPEMVKRLEVPSLTNIDMFGKSRVGEAANAITDTMTKSVMRASGITDKIVKDAAIRGSLYEQAVVHAKRMGTKGDEAKRIIDELVAKPTDEMLLDAKAAADVITFTNDGRLSDTISMAIEGAANRAGKKRPENAALVRAAARFIMPFRRTPSNILSTSLRYAPITGQLSFVSAARDWTKALADASITQAISDPKVLKAQREMIERFTKQGTGLAMFGLGAMLYKNKVLTGEFPTNTAEAEQWRLEGKQPESLLVNGQWVPISRISPYGGMLTMAATALSYAEEKGNTPDLAGLGKTIAESPVKAGAESARMVAKSVLNQPMVTGPQGVLEYLTSRKEPEGTGIDLGSFIPSVVSQSARAEGVQRMPQTLEQEVTSRIPGMQKSTPVRLDIFGQPVEKAGGKLNVMLNPLPFTPDRRSKDPLVAEMSRIGVSIGAMSKKKGEDFGMYQYRQREAGKWVRQDLEGLLQSEEYRTATPDEKRRLMKRTVEDARTEFSRYLKENYDIEGE